MRKKWLSGGVKAAMLFSRELDIKLNFIELYRELLNELKATRQSNVDGKLVSYGVLVVGKTCIKILVRMFLSAVRIICICLAYFQKMANSWTNRVKFLVR
jgi:hypothetical protein